MILTHGVPLLFTESNCTWIAATFKLRFENNVHSLVIYGDNLEYVLLKTHTQHHFELGRLKDDLFGSFSIHGGLKKNNNMKEFDLCSGIDMVYIKVDTVPNMLDGYVKLCDIVGR